MMDDDDCGDIIYSVYIYIYPIQVTKYNTERNWEGKPQVPSPDLTYLIISTFL